MNVVNTLVAVASEFSPRYERHRDDLVSIDVSGLDRLIGPPRTIGEELRRAAAARGVHVHVALARTRSAAVVLALARAGFTVVDAGSEWDALAPLPISVLEKAYGLWRTVQGPESEALSLEPLCRRWGIKTLGEFAALPPAELSSRLGQHALAWQAIARGQDAAPLVPTPPEERFESSLELEWPVEGLEPLSFVLTRLLEPLSARLERRDRGAALLHLELRLVTNPSTLRQAQDRSEPSRGTTGSGRGEQYARHLQLPSPIRDVRTLRTLLLLNLESHPPPAAIDRVTIVIDPTPGRVVQHTLFTRAHPTPEQLSTLLARLGALMGQDRIGRPAAVDSHRPGAFRMEPFATEHDHHDDQPGSPARQPRWGPHRRNRRNRRETYLENSALENSAGSASSALDVVSALRRCRQPVPARAVIEDGRPTRLTTDRRGFAGGRVLTGTGPWRTSGNWWNSHNAQLSTVKSQYPGSDLRLESSELCWSRDEWDVALADGAVYRIFRDRDTDGWFIDAIVD